MPRQRRFTLPGYPQHVIQRGNNRQRCFFNHGDYYFFLDQLESAARECDCSVHAFVLMTNHMHLLVTPNLADALPKMMQSLGRKFVCYINHRHKRTGTLWEGRYKSTVVDSDAYLLACYRYIELNPVRAGIVGSPSEYRWSSHLRNAHGKGASFIEEHPTYLALGINDTTRQAAYRRLFDRQIDEREIMQIRESTQKGWPLGTDRFRGHIETILHTPIPRNNWGGMRRGSGRKHRYDERR